MSDSTHPTYLEPTQESGREFFTRNISGKIVMLNLLRFRSVADYSATPHLAPATPISGEAAYRLYIEHTLPHLTRVRRRVALPRQGRRLPDRTERRTVGCGDAVRQSSVGAFMAFASNPEYMAGIGHRLPLWRTLACFRWLRMAWPKCCRISELGRTKEQSPASSGSARRFSLSLLLL